MCAKSIHHRRAIFRDNFVVSPKQRRAKIVGQLAPNVIHLSVGFGAIRCEKIYDRNFVLFRFDENVRHVLRQIVELRLLGQERRAEGQRAKQNHQSSNEIGHGRFHGSILLGPVSAVKSAVLDRFAEVFWGDGVGGFEVGDGAGDF